MLATRIHLLPKDMLKKNSKLYKAVSCAHMLLIVMGGMDAHVLLIVMETCMLKSGQENIKHGWELLMITDRSGEN